MSDYGAPSSASVIVESGCSSLEFDGVNDQISIQSSTLSTSFSSFSSLTIEAWIKWSDDNSLHYPIIQQGWGTQDALFYLGLTGSDDSCGGSNTVGSLYFEFKSNPNDPSGCLTSDALAENIWTHVAAVYDAGNIKLFINGVQNAEQQLNTSSLSSINQGDSYIGYSLASGGTYFLGSIDSIHLSNTVLFSQDFTPNTHITSNVDSIAIWNGDDELGALLDSSGNGHHGTINGATWVNSCPEEDSDGDGVAAWEDCDDADANSNTVSEDGDCDGVLTVDDCDDGDANSNIVPEDGDCDGVLTADDCDDSDPSIIGYDGQSVSCPGESCLEIYNAGASSGDGDYYLDISGVPTLYTCDMSNGGWTYLWMNGSMSISNNSYSSQLFSAPFPHSSYHMEFQYYFYRTWDGEIGYSRIDGATVWSQNWYYTWHGNGNSHWGTSSVNEEVSGAHSASTLSLQFGNTLNQSFSDEGSSVNSIYLKVK
jgi:hypothetical protein